MWIAYVQKHISPGIPGYVGICYILYRLPTIIECIRQAQKRLSYFHGNIQSPKWTFLRQNNKGFRQRQVHFDLAQRKRKWSCLEQHVHVDQTTSGFKKNSVINTWLQNLTASFSVKKKKASLSKDYIDDNEKDLKNELNWSWFFRKTWKTNFAFLQSHYECKTCFWYPALELESTGLRIRTKHWKFVVKCSYRPLDRKTGHFTSPKG